MSAFEGSPVHCLFCRIISKKEKSHIVFEDKNALAFLDIHPLFYGHTLLVPRAHYELMSDLPAALTATLFTAAQMLSVVVRDAMGAQGTFVAMNNKVSQSVPHFHIHIVPRTKGDGLKGFFWPRTKYRSDEEIQSTLAKLKSEIVNAGG